jgi:threonine/homoserine/homoserine lactone efflux protein
MLVALLHGISFSTAPLLGLSPFKIFVFSAAVRQGWRRALPLALVPLIADIPIILVLWIVVRQFPSWFVDGLRTLGGLFYLYLAFTLLRSTRQEIDSRILDHELRRSFWQAVVAVWLTPNVYINWTVIGVPALIEYGSQSAWQAIMFLLGFYALWILGLGLQIILVGQANRLVPQGRFVLILAGSALLSGFGLYLIGTGLQGLLAS